MKAIGIVPARLGATRFPGKPMASILGMPMVGHCYHRTRLTPGLARTCVATCDKEIADYVRGIGGDVVMTASTHTRATTRTAEAMEFVEADMGEHVDAVVMVQGDEPLVRPDTIAEALAHLSDPTVDIVNIMSRLRTLEQFSDRNNVKVVVNQRHDALYFSREPIPSPWKGWEHLPRYMQTGVIAFRREALLLFNQTAETSLERIESVDMNRVLETGGRIRMVLTDAETLGVDTPEELKQAEAMMEADPIRLRYLAGGEARART